MSRHDRNVTFLNPFYISGYLHPRIQGTDSGDKLFSAFFGRVILRAYTCGAAHLLQFFIHAGAVSIQHIRHDDRVCKSVGHIVLPAERMRYGMDVSHIGPGKSKSCPVRGKQHIGTGFFIGAVFVGFFNIGKNKFRCGKRHLAGFLCGGASDVGFHRVGQRIHPGGCGEGRRQGVCHGSIQNGIPRN